MKLKQLENKYLLNTKNLKQIRRSRILFIITLIAMISMAVNVFSDDTSTSVDRNYFDHITLFSDGRITRFTHMPIQVYISPILKESRYLPEIRFAIQVWEAASEGKIQFQETETPANADIRVTWGYSSLMGVLDTRLGSAVLRRLTDNRELSSYPNEQSQPNLSSNKKKPNGEDTTSENKNNFSVEIILILEVDESQTELSNEEMRTVCLHEFGHAIGLWGHSPHPGDICYPTAAAQTPSQRDINTLIKLYNTPIDTPQHDTAIDALKTEIMLEPRHHYPHFLLGTVYYDKGDMESAIHSLKNCIKLNENFQPAIEKLLQAYKDTGQLETAINLLKQRIQEKPSAADFNTLGIHYYHQGAVDRAIDAFKSAVKLEPFHKASKHNLHQLYREKALNAMYSKDYSLATKIFERMIQLNPLDSRSYTLMGDRYAEADDFTSAIQYYQKALELNPVSRLTKRGLARCYNNYGVTLRNSLQWDKAITAYRKALELQPAFHIARTNLSDAFWQKANNLRNSGKVEKAIDTYLELQELNPTDTRISSLLGELYLKKRKYSAAVTAFQNVYLTEPNAPQARHNLVAAYHQTAQNLIDQRNYQSAINLLQKAIVLAPTEPNIRVSLAHAYQNIGDYQGAQVQLTQILKDKPNNKQATTEQINLYIRRGNTLVKQKNYPGALVQFSAIPEEQRDLVIDNIIGYLYLVQDEYTQALTAFEKVVAHDPYNISTYLNLVSLESKIASRLFEKGKTDKLIRARCVLAICLLNQRQLEASLTKYKQAIDSKSEAHKQILIDTGIKLARGFEAQNDTDRSAAIRSWLSELDPIFNKAINDR